jgi:hypothetical protein
MSRAVFALVHQGARQRAAQAVANAPDGYTVTVAPATRNSSQNALLHALLTEIAKELPWAGRKRDAETWKRLLTASWLRARGESIEVLPALDGHGIDVVFRRTSDLTKGECAELVDFIYAWATEQGVTFTEPATA